MRKDKTAISLTIFLLAWELTSRALNNPLYPPPSEVALTLTHPALYESLGINYLLTSVRALTGFATGLIAGLGLGILSSAKQGQDYIQPIATILFVVPSVAWIPLLIVWIGVKPFELPVIASFMCSFPPVLYGTINALRTLDKDEVEAALTLGAKPPLIFKKLIIPQLMLKIMPLIKSEAVMSWKTVFVTEMVALSSGLGYLAIMFSETLEISGLLAVISVLALTTLGIIQALDRLESRLTIKWFGDEDWLRYSSGM